MVERSRNRCSSLSESYRQSRRLSIGSKSPGFRKRSNQHISITQIVLLSVCVSIISQAVIIFAFPYLQEVISSISNNNQTLKAPLEGNLIEPERKLKSNVQRITFLVDPLDKPTPAAPEPIQKLLSSDEFQVQNDKTKINEALAAAKASKKFRQNGNIEKALAIIQHAFELAPTEPDILIEMGQVKELNQELIEADHCYFKALAYDPANTEALSLKARTFSIVSAIDRKMLQAVHKLLKEFTYLQHSSALRRMMRETYFLYVYHTVALEGNTLSLGQTRSILETGSVVPGKSLREHNEVIGMDAALRYLNTTLLSRLDGAILIDDILEIHKRVIGNADPIEAGRFRRTQVYVGRFTPCAPEYVQQQMEELIEWLNNEETYEMDPIERAAIAHYKLVLVHPFTDGNGRTARLLMNLILMRSGFPPVILPVESRAEYYGALHVANLGDIRPFIRYVSGHTKKSLEKYIASVKTTETCIDN